jgi:endoglucanase
MFERGGTIMRRNPSIALVLLVVACSSRANPADDNAEPGLGGSTEQTGGAAGASVGGTGGTAGTGGSGVAPGSPGSFLKVQGTTIVDGQGHEVLLRGASFGNEVWANRAVPDDHAEIDFGRLQTMGANSTRFLLNYVTFEDDAAPGVYKKAGWDWIDQNIAWAKAHGIYLILNMHVPEGGFQSDGKGDQLWTDPTNQDRLTALWKAIASHYVDETIIAGFGLVNEPHPTASRQQWQDLASKITAAIRSVDTNHMVFVERTNAVNGDFAYDANMNLFTQADKNTVYEFHFYDPTDYTFQLQPWNNSPEGGAYPDPNKIGGVTEQWINLATFDAPTAPAGTTDWTSYESTRITAAAGKGIAVGKLTLVGQALGAGTIAFDDLSIKEYDAAGTFTREVAHIFPTSNAGWPFWSKDGSGKAATTSPCKTSATCLSITGTTDDASYGGVGYYFVPKEGFQYSVAGWMKGTNLPAGAIARMRVDLIGSSTPVRVRDKAGLIDFMAPYLAWSKTHNVPLFLGEFGVYKACFANNKGGLTWVGDVYDIATGVGAPGASRVTAISFHQYHEDAFALYYGNSGPVVPTNANQPLIDLLTAKFSAH